MNLLSTIKLCFNYLYRKLLEFGANPGITNNEGKTTLELAEDEMLQAMIQKEIEKQGTYKYAYEIIMDTCCDCYS